MIPADEVIGRVFRNTRLQDTSYIADMQEWLTEVTSVMRVKYDYVRLWQDIKIDFHKGALPQNLAYIECIIYNGCRVHQKSDGVGFTGHELPQNYNPILISTAVMTQNPVTHNNVYVGVFNDTDLIPPGQWWSDQHYYFREGRCISFSCADAVVRAFYHAVPTDKNGLPFIPDNEAAKETIYWYIKMKIIEAGYNDPLFKWKDCWNMYNDIYLPRAIEQLRTPSLDEMDRMVNNIQYGHL